jgi:hypothetical protein
MYSQHVDIRHPVAGQSWVAAGDLILVHCATLVSAVTVRELVSYSARRTEPPKLAIIYVLEGTVLGVPDELCRAAFVDLSRHGERIYSSVSVVIPAGFASSIVRAFVGSVRLMSRAKLPMELSQDTDEAIDWARKHVAPGMTLPSTPLIHELLAKMRT